MTKNLRPLVVALLAAGALLALPLSSPADTTGQRYLVLLADAPLASYKGGTAGLAATDPSVTGARRLDARSAASRAYLSYLQSRQDQVLGSLRSALGRDVQTVFRYRVVVNGFAAVLSDGEAERARNVPGVTRVVQDYNLRLKTDAGPAWIGAPGVWSGSASGAAGTRGEGIVVGVIDTGINHDHPSFADPGGDGFSYSSYGAPSGPGYRGLCDPITGAPFCNDKLVGVYDFTGTSPLDDNGHGSHTASTAAGNVLEARIVAPTMTLVRNISGVAPHARVISYKACVTAGAEGACPASGTVSSIEAATLDAVDVINFSIGGVSRDPWTDPPALAFLNARRAGIFLAVSAGNEGPGAGTVGSPADSPWVTAVGAATHNRLFSNSLTGLSGGATAPPPTLAGKGITTGYGPAPIVYAGNFGSPLCGAGPAEAATNPWPAGTFHGEIVVCDRGTYGRVQKGQFLKEAGAGGMVLANDEPNGDSVVGDTHHLPAVHITYRDGVTLKAWLAQGSGHTGRIGGLVTDESPANGDVTASFSSRGPNPSVPGVVKPDVTAPGVDILAAFNTPAGSIGAPPEYNSISGTSMSGPHTAGAAALLRAVHPEWSPDEVRSALVTTGFTSGNAAGSEAHGVLKEDASTAADPFDMGGGRVELRRAARAGLVLDVEPATYDAANPASGGNPSSLNLPSLGNAACAGTCSWTRVVKSSASSTVTWGASASAGGGLSLSVQPSSFTLAPGQTQTITVTADASGVGEAWAFGRVLLSSGTGSVPDAALPVAVKSSGGGGPVTPRVTLHFHGNAGASGADHDSGHAGEGACSGDGKSDLLLCGAPYLLENATLSPSPAASWKGGPAEWGLDSSVDRTIHDPSWIWCLRKDDPANTNEFQCPETETPARGTTTVAGPMTVEWWAQCALTCAAVATTWDIRLFADGVLAHGVQVDAGTAPTGVPTKLTATINLPSITANHRFALVVEPVFLIDQAVEFTIFYDSTQPCAPTSAGACDSIVRMPVVSSGGTANRQPNAADDSAAVERGGSVDVNVLANDSDPDQDTLTVTSFTNGQYGTVTKNANGTLKYTQDGGPTSSDSFTYTINDGRGGADTATVTVDVTGPDLTVTAVEVTSNGGNRQSIDATVANTGESNAPATSTEFVLDDSTVLGTVATPAIDAGASRTVSLSWNTNSVRGEHRITVTADKGAAAAETNESNNAATRTVDVKGNKVRNGSFEQSSNGTSPDNWTSSGATTYEQGGSDGERSAAAGSGGTWTSDPVEVTPGSSYDLEVAIAGATGGVALQELSGTGQLLRTLQVPVPAIGAVFSTIARTVSVGNDTVAVRVVLSGPLLGVARFDAVGLFDR